MKTTTHCHASASACGRALLWAAMLAFAAPAPAAEAPVDKLNTGDFAGVIADTTRLLAARADDPVALRLRGLARLATDDNAGALSDLAAAAPLATGDDAAQAHIFIFIAQRRLGHAAEAKPALATASTAWPDGWSKTVARYLTGELATGAFYTSAGQGDRATAAAHTAAMQFFLGEELLAINDLTGARNFFDPAAKAASPTAPVETVLARAELAKLDLLATNARSLANALRAGETDTALALLARDRRLANFTAKPTDQTPLYCAIAGGRLAAVRTLLDTGAKIEATDLLGSTPLFRAAVIADEVAYDEKLEAIMRALFGTTDPADFANAIKSHQLENMLNNISRDREKIAELIQAMSRRSTLPPEAEAERLAILRLLLARGANVNHRDKLQGSPLLFAARFPNRQAAELLLARGADSSAYDFGGLTALHMGALVAGTDFIQSLLDHKVDINQRTASGRPTTDTALGLVAAAGDVSTVQFLLEHGAKLNPSSSEFFPPLLAAVNNGREQVVGLLLEKGADPNLTPVGYMSALHEAASSGSKAMVEALLAHGANVNARDKLQFTPLLNAVERDHPEIVKLLLAKGADPRAREYRNSTGLNLACDTGDVELIQLFLGLGIDVNDRATYGGGTFTPIYNAVAAGRLAAVKFLLEKGAKVIDPISPTKETLLISAARGPMSLQLFIETMNPKTSQPKLGSKDDYRAIVDLLLANGADFAAKDAGGSTAMHHAAAWGNLPVMELLFARGLAVDAPNEIGFTPLLSATNAVEPATAAVVEFLLTHGAKLSPRDKYGRTPIHCAAGTGKADVVAMLLQRGADVAARDNSGQTPLHAAALKGDPATVRLLLEHKAAADVLDRAGNSPLHYAVLIRPPGMPAAEVALLRPPADKLEVVKILLAQSASPRTRSVDGSTPEDYARQYGTPEILAALH